MKNFNVKTETENIINWIKNYYEEHRLGGAVLGISGGKDSAVVAGLMVKALGPENVVGLWLPCHSKEEDKKDAQELANHLGIKLFEKDLTTAYESIRLGLSPDPNGVEYKDADINLKPRLRMSTVYYYAAYLSKLTGKTYIVPGTSNACEIYVGYFTKGGDNVADIKPIANLTVDEVIAVGDELGLPKHIVHKTPDDGLSGMSDEEKLGVKYSDIARCINDYKEALDNMESKTFVDIAAKHAWCQHKFNVPEYKPEE